MPRKGENIYKRADGRWEGRYIKEHKNGRAIYGYVYGKTYAVTKQKQREKSAALKAEQSPYKPATLREIIPLWSHAIQPCIKESAFARYQFLVQRHILPALGNYMLIELTEMQVGRWTQTLLRSGRLDKKGGLSAKTVTDILSVLKNIVAFAERNGFETHNSLHHATVKKSSTTMHILSAEEQRRLERYLLTLQTPAAFGILLSLYTGARIGEICALRWEDVDLEQHCIRIRQTVQRIQNNDKNAAQKTKVVQTNPKSPSSIRTIPLSAKPAELATQLQGTPDSFVLTGETGRPMEPRTLQNHFQRILKDAGLRKVNYHTLRHTFATRCMESGTDMKTLSELLGHANVGVTLNRYIHSTEDRKRQCIQKLAEAFL